MRKRVRFIISSILLALGLLATQAVSSDLRYFAISLFFVTSYSVGVWALTPTINGVEWLTIAPFPAFYALAVALFYFLLPGNLITRLVIITLFGVGMYALYLSSNILAYGKIKTIQLLRAAHAVESMFLLLMLLFFYNFLFSLHLHPVFHLPLVSLVSFFPILCAVWSVDLESRISKKVLYISLFFSLFLGEVAFSLSLLPVGLWTGSLYLTALVYVGFGIIQSHSIGRLFAQTIREYLWLVAFVTTALIFLIQWK